MSTEKLKWPVTLSLTLEDMKQLYIKAGEGGLTVKELLESFVCDLVGSRESRVQDDMDRAENWYERRGFEALTDRGFLSYMVKHEDAKRADHVWDSMKRAEKRLAAGPRGFRDLEEMRAVERDVEYWRKELEDFYRSYESYTGKKGRGLEVEIRDLEKWHNGWLELQYPIPHLRSEE